MFKIPENRSFSTFYPKKNFKKLSDRNRNSVCDSCPNISPGIRTPQKVGTTNWALNKSFWLWNVTVKKISKSIHCCCLKRIRTTSLKKINSYNFNRNKIALSVAVVKYCAVGISRKSWCMILETGVPATLGKTFNLTVYFLFPVPLETITIVIGFLRTKI